MRNYLLDATVDPAVAVNGTALRTPADDSGISGLALAQLQQELLELELSDTPQMAEVSLLDGGTFVTGASPLKFTAPFILRDLEPTIGLDGVCPVHRWD